MRASSSACDCTNGCADHHCDDVNRIFDMIEWDRDGGQGGVLLHAIGNPDDVNNLLNNGRIDWLTAISFGDSYPIINDCTDKTSDNPPSCSAHALLRSDLLPIAFNYPDDVESMHPIGLVYDPFALTENNPIVDMYVLDADTVDTPAAKHAECTVESGWDWQSNYNGNGDAYDPYYILPAMQGQCIFSVESEDNWAGFWGNFIDARKNFLMVTRSGDTSLLPDGRAYLEPEIDVWISDSSAWEDMYENALKAVLVQTNYPAARGNSRRRASHALWVATLRIMVVVIIWVVVMMTTAMAKTTMTGRRRRRRRRKRKAVT